MTSSATPLPLRPLPSVRRRALHALVYGVLGLIGVAIIGVVLDLTVRNRRGASQAAAQHLRLMLDAGEVVQSEVNAIQRHWWDRFSETRGVLAVTDRRLIFVGVAPRDILEHEPGPPVLDVHTFSFDTVVTVRQSRVYFGLSSGLTLSTLRDTESFALPSGEGERMRALMLAVDRHRAAQLEVAARERRAQVEAAEAAARPRIHIVLRGEALTTIATSYNTTIETLRQLNGLANDQIKAGQRLIVGIGDTVRSP